MFEYLLAMPRKASKHKKGIVSITIVVMMVASMGVGLLMMLPEKTEAAYTDFSYHKLITISSAKVGHNLVDFPVWVYNTSADFKDTSNGGNIQPDGDDIAFYSYDNSTQYNHEIEIYNGVTGLIGIWVNATSVSSSVDTKFWIYYGDADGTNQQNPKKVWDSDFVDVQHLHNVSAGTAFDSTANNIDGTEVGAIVDVMGKTWKGGYAAGADTGNYVDWPLNSTNPHLVGASAITMSCWILMNNTAGNNHYLWNLYTGGVGVVFTTMVKHTDSRGLWRMRPNPADTLVWSKFNGGTFTQGAWYYTAIVCDFATDNQYLYINGSLDNSTPTDTPWTATQFTQSGAPTLKEVLFTCKDHDYSIDGCIDEFRVSKVARNTSWIYATYNTSNSPTDFLTFGTEGAAEGETTVSLSGLTANRITWAGQDGATVWCNSSGDGTETMDIVITDGTTTITEIRISTGDLNDTGDIIQASNIYMEVSSVDTTWSGNTIAFDGDGTNISINASQWTNNWCNGADPFPIAGSDHIYVRFKLTIPGSQAADNYYSLTSTTWKVYIIG